MPRSYDPREYELIVRQEPKQARMCGVGADRRPIDPPPIVQLRVVDRSQRRAGSVKEGDDAGSRASSPGHSSSSSFLQNPYYFMFASLAKPDEDVELHWLKDGKTRCTTGSVVSSLYHLKDSENQNEDAGFFVFPDLSVRTEGSYRLKLSLFEVVGSNVYHCKSIFSAPFYVYTAKKFPGMEESTPLSCSLADQGIKIRIRKDIRVRKKAGVSDMPQPIPMPLPVPVPLPSNGNSSSSIPPPMIFPSSTGPPVRLDPIEPDEQDTSRDRDRNGAADRDRDRDGTRDDDRQREKDRELDREYDRDKERRPSNADRKTNLRRDSASTGLGASDRSAKRMRGEDSYGELPEPTLPPQSHQQHPQAGSPVAIAPPPAPIQPSPWSGSLDPALNAAPASNGPPAPSAPPSAPMEHQPPPQHYAPPPGPYDHRYAPAPAPAPAYHYDHAPPPGHQPPPPQHYGHPPPHYAHPPPPSYAYPPPTQWQSQAQPYQQDPYAHTYAPQAHGPPHPHAPPPHHPPPPRYDYSNAYQQPQPQAYPGYYDHHPPPPPHAGYPPRSPQSVGYDYSTPAPAPPPTNQTAPPYRPEPTRQDSSAGRPATTPSGYPYPTPPPPHYANSAYPPPPPGPTSAAPPHYASTSHHPSSHALPPPPSQQQQRGPPPPNHYQLSSPSHQASGYSGYPVPPPPPGSSTSTTTATDTVSTTAGGGGATTATSAAAGAWGSTFAAPPLHTASWGPVPSDGYAGGAGSYGGGQQQQQQQPGRIQLAPLRTPPATGAGERNGGGKKNPLSIGNIISDEN